VSRRNTSDDTRVRREQAKEKQEESNLDFILNLLSLTPRQKPSNRPQISEGNNHMFDYNFSLLQTVILILLIGFLAMGGLLFGISIIT
jgi:hypothetical protein